MCGLFGVGVFVVGVNLSCEVLYFLMFCGLYRNLRKLWVVFWWCDFLGIIVVRFMLICILRLVGLLVMGNGNVFSCRLGEVFVILLNVYGFCKYIVVLFLVKVRFLLL